jgi:hypothetical protein
MTEPIYQEGDEGKDESREEFKEGKIKTGLKIAACLTFLVFSLVLWLASGRSWLVLLLLSLPCYACEEWLGGKIFGEQSWLNRFSVSRSGFSIWRIVFGVIVVLCFFGAVYAGRLLFLHWFR